MPGRVLVTGASGGLGQALMPLLRRRGWTVRALTHRSPVTGGDETVEGDVTDMEAMVAAMRGVDAVMHLAAATHARRKAAYERVNVHGTAGTIRAAAEAGARRFVLVSTRANSRLGGAYSRSKQSAESAVTASGLDHVVIRLPEVYGLGGREGVDAIIDSARRSATILVPGGGPHELTPLHADDVSAMLAGALEASAGSEYTLCGETITVEGFARRCVRAFDSSSRIVRIPGAALRVASVPARIVPLPLYPDQLDRLRAPKAACTPEAERDFDTRFRTLDEGLLSLRNKWR
jgi:nucleoside-diphosphate-sugar epimerase